MDDSLYSTDLTPEEQELGFELLLVKNPRGEFAFAPPKVQAVVKVLGPSDRIIKMNFPGGYAFKHQRYGYFGTRRIGSLDWLPMGDISYPTAIQAVQMIATGAAEELESRLGPSSPVTPVEPGDDF